MGGKRSNCCVPGCSNVRAKVKIPFYRIPKAPRRRRAAFIRLIGRDWRWKPSENTRICAQHFVGELKCNNPGSESYLPSLGLPNSKNRLFKTRNTKNSGSADRQIGDNTETGDSGSNTQECEGKQQQQHCLQTQTHERCSVIDVSIDTGGKGYSDLSAIQDSEPLTPLQAHTVTTSQQSLATVEKGSDVSAMTSQSCVQYFDHDYVVGHWTTFSVADHVDATQNIRALRKANHRLEEENKLLKKKILAIDIIKVSDENCQRYTGLPNYATFRAVFEFLEADARKLVYWDGQKTKAKQSSRKPRERSKLTLQEEFFVTLVRLKLNPPLFDLARQMGLTTSHLSNTIITWIHFLANSLGELIDIPQYSDIERVLSPIAKEFLGTRVVIDCTEWYTQRPSHLMPRKQIWSNYKHENTVKWLVGVSLKGAICYVSSAWGGRASDKHITKASGLLDELNPGDGVMADRGFDIETELSRSGIELHIPAFKGSDRSQLTSHEVHYSRRVAAVRIQVERAIGKLKSFHIFDKRLPLSMVNSADAIFKTCAFLTNFQKPVLKAAEE